MNQDVVEAIEELKRAFPDSSVMTDDDGQGGARVIVDPVDLGARFEPRLCWMGGHLTAFYPNADIYPMFIAAEVKRIDGKAFEVPVTHGAHFLGRPAIQISRMNNNLHLARQTALAKFVKILHFLEQLP